MKNQILQSFQQKYAAPAKLHPTFRPGDTVRVHYKIAEASSSADEKKYRIQQFEGVCLRYKKGLEATFVIRKVGANSVGVERTFPINSPYIDKIDLVAGGRVRRSRLFYLRERSGRSARIKTRRFKQGEQLTSQEK